MNSPEIIYLDHDNTIDLILKADGTPEDLSGVTKITASFGDTLITSEDAANGAITWAQENYEDGEIRLALGDEEIEEGNHTVWIVVYDAVNTEGIVWGNFRAKVLADPEAE